MAAKQTINVTLVKSTIGRIEKHKASVRGLGLRRMHQTVTVEDTPATRGMIRAVSYLVKVDEDASPVTKAVKPAKKPAAKKAAPAKAAASTATVSSLPKKFSNKDGSDKLQMVEGIGPKIAELLNNDGITTFAQLSETKVDHIASILKAAGSRYALANPGTWPEQAALLANGELEAFEKLTDELDGGVRK